MGSGLAILGIVAVISIIGYVGWSGGFINKDKVSGILPEVRHTDFPTGDSIDLILPVPPPEQVSEIPSEQPPQNYTVGVPISNSTIYGGDSQSYGTTTQYSKVLQKDTYQIGTEFPISAKLVKIIPDSCEMQDGKLVNCDYLSPAKFKYLFYVTCDFRAFCNLDDISRWDYTDNNGFLTEMLRTSENQWTAGTYLASISANSEVKDANGMRYEIKVDYYFTMVG